MNKDELKKIVADPNHISSIYNYCDRWCERCRLTSKCSLYMMTEEPEKHDSETHGESMLQQMTDSFELAMDLIKEYADRQGLNLTTSDFAEEKIEEPLNHPLVQSAKGYAADSSAWLECSKALFIEKQTELQSKLQMGLKESDPLADSVGLNDSIEVIRWYQHQIHTKLFRAIDGLHLMEFEDKEGYQRSSDGSAKVAQIGIDCSISAWGELYTQFPSQRHAILELLVQLDGISKNTKKVFPKAMMFIRPGFDEEIL